MTSAICREILASGAD